MPPSAALRRAPRRHRVAAGVVGALLGVGAPMAASLADPAPVARPMVLQAAAVGAPAPAGVAPGAAPPLAASPSARPPTTAPAPPRTFARTSGAGHLEALAVPVAGEPAPRRVVVYRPGVPDSAALPVVYLLHGVPGVADDVFGAGLAGVLDQVFASGVAPFVVAAPDGNGTAHADTEWADARGTTADKIETFVTGPVIAAVERAGRRPRSRRAIAGFSMGGYGALNLAQHRPDLYGQALSLAGYFHVDDPSGMFGNDPATVDRNAPDRHLGALRQVRVALLDAVDDREPVVAGETQRMSALLAAAGVPVSMGITPGSHGWAWATAQWPATARWLAAGWR